MDHARPIILLNMLILVLVAVVAAQKSLKKINKNIASICTKNIEKYIKIFLYNLNMFYFMDT